MNKRFNAWLATINIFYNDFFIAEIIFLGKILRSLKPEASLFKILLVSKRDNCSEFNGKNGVFF